MSRPKITFPEKTCSKEELLAEVKQRKTKDIDWRKGRAFCLVYYPGDEREEKIKAVYDQFYADNALNPTATPSLAGIEAETVSMCADLFHGDENTRGNITTGGTESILLAIKTARDWALKNRPQVKRPNVVLPESVHPAFMKAFHYFDVDFIVTKTGADGKADVSALKQAITHDTIMLVASAPSYPYGVMDPISEIAEIARKKKLLFHVDACIGGFMFPFIKQLGYPVPAFDFEVEGVTSISADIHKYGYSSKGASVILYRNAALRKFQFSLYTKWHGGIYGSPTMLGTRAGCSIAGAWAALKGIGREGYLEMAEATMKATLAIRSGIEKIDGLEIVAKPEMSLIAFTSNQLDIYALADELNKRGWHFERQQLPPTLHLTVNYIHRNITDEFLHDLNKAAEVVRHKKMAHLSSKLQAATVKGLSKILPAGTIAKLQKGGTDGIESENKAAMYGMMGALSGTQDLEEMVLDFLDTIYSVK